MTMQRQTSVRSAIEGALLLLLLALHPTRATSHLLPSRCSACLAVSGELQDRLDHEKPRNHLDMRHRLDKDGKRYGRQIPWHASELRVIELLEGMCDAVAEAHELHAVVAGAEHEWVRSDGLPADRVVDRHRRKEERKQLGVFCHSLVEEKEDRLNGALQSKAGIDVNQLEALLCDRHCKSSANNQNAEL